MFSLKWDNIIIEEEIESLEEARILQKEYQIAYESEVSIIEYSK